ncbi:hypothetical protein E2562_020192 [Oryza meyeriana var. granulata]|uniref:Uncharacterized protein n=1 Tax=Oryza meyeriana var. granulata TaxID=110450 RepID=A0A6G1BKX0_9ORYZ|nr:hypothetical protein E2562_020192 [Oryza meyeriana var. granulata]
MGARRPRLSPTGPRQSLWHGPRPSQCKLLAFGRRSFSNEVGVPYLRSKTIGAELGHLSAPGSMPWCAGLVP